MKTVTEISVIVTVASPRGFASAAEMGAFTLLLGLLPNSQDAHLPCTWDSRSGSVGASSGARGGLQPLLLLCSTPSL